MTQDPKIYEAAKNAAVWCDLQGFEDIYSLRGPGFLEFLNSYNSQDIKNLPQPGVALGTFLTQKGKLVASTVLLREKEQILLLLPRGYGPKVAENLAVYLDFSEVELHEQSDVFFHLVLLGPQANQGPLQGLPPPELKNSAHLIGNDASPLWVFSTDRWGMPAWEVLGVVQQRADFVAQLPQAIPQGDESLLEILRIEAGLPKLGVDMSEENLLAEVGLDDRATSFNKGCYLGQETTARVRSRGHVNRRLARFALSEAPQSTLPLTISQAGQEVGTLTSWAQSPKLNQSIGLATVKRSALESEEPLKIETRSQTFSLQPLDSNETKNS